MSIRKRGARSYQVRVPGFPAQTAPTREAAEKIELDLLQQKALGDRYEVPAMTLGDAIDATLAAIDATAGVSEKTRAHTATSARFWAPLRAETVSSLRREPVEAMILARAERHPRSAKNELEFLKRVLEEAKRRGQRVDAELFEIPPVRHRPRKSRGLTAQELLELAACFPEQSARLILLAGQVGCRQSVWFNLTDEMLDLDAGTLTIPAALAKRHREHRIHLTDVEVELLREQLDVRPAGTSLMFPTPEGKRWTPNRFRDRVWLRSLDAAIEGESSVYEGFTFHLLRHTAASLMALAGVDADVAAERLEHSDGGALFHKTHAHLHEGQKRAQPKRLEALVHVALDGERTDVRTERLGSFNQAVSQTARYWAQLTCVICGSVGRSALRGIQQLYEGGFDKMRHFTSRPKLGLLALVGFACVAFAIALSGSSQTAAPIASGISNHALDALTAGPSVERSNTTKPLVTSTPQQLSLIRAHGAVFNVRSLKSVVVRKDRPEYHDPLGGDGDMYPTLNGAKSTGAKDLPAKLAASKLVKNSTTNTATPSADSSFDGLDFANWGAGHPPDENGDVGPTYYIQTVNTSIGIYDKSTGNRVAAFTFNSFMSQGHFGNLCDTNNFGDPIVLYDSYENRWFISDFAFTLDANGNLTSQSYQCFAVSKTGDPVNGGWNYYSITAPSGFLGDYPKFGIWPDGIYMSANLFAATGGAYSAFHVWALNKQQMYADAPQASVVDFSGTSADFTVIPANSKIATGAPPAGSPEYFVSTELYVNALAIYKFQVNWDKISTSTFTGPFAEAEPNCWPDVSPTSAATPANVADTLPLRTMFAPQYTNIGGVESVWVAHTTDRGTIPLASCGATTASNASVRWYQANVTGGNFTTNLTQSSTFDPDGANTNYRYQPALAVDRLGDMAMTYTKSNSTTNPQVMYDGRLAGDPLNTLGTENTLIAGTGAQSGNCGTSACIRWGDYAGMELDPNGCEFWMTGEYFATTGLNDLTRIGSFHDPGCTPIGNGTLSGQVTDGTNPISGATLTLGSRTTTTDANGNYSFTLPAGTYPSLLADQPGYTEGSATQLAVPDGGTLTQSFTLSTASTSNCLTDATQSTFQRGVPANCDLTGNPGVVQLTAPDNTAAQNATIGATGLGPVTNTAWIGQTFTPTVSGKLHEVDVELFCSGCTTASPNITLSIRATSAGLPTGADLATSTVPGFNDSAAGGLHAFVLNTPLQVTAGTSYSFVFRLATTFPTGTMAYTCSCSSTSGGTNPYTSGTRVTSANSGSTWSTDTRSRDLHFVTYINPGFASSGTFVSSIKDANPATGATPDWSTLSFADTTPANTNVQFQVAASNSQYGPWNYVGPDGTASTYFTTSGASLSQFNGYRYIRYEAFLTSSNTGATPVLSSVTTCFTDVATSTSLAAASASGTYGGTTTLSATLTAGANGVQGKTVSFTLNGSPAGSATTNASGVATLNSVSLAGNNAGPYSSGVGASFAGDGGYTASSNTAALTISRADQAIMISQHAPSNAAVDDQFTVAATASSGDAVTYGSLGSCTNNGATYTITDTGACLVTYDQIGDPNYNAAPELTESVNSSKANQTIHVTTAAPSSAAYGTDFTVAATGGHSGNPVTYGALGGCTNNGADFSMTSGNTDCTVTFDQAGNSKYNDATEVTETVTAQKADQTIDVTTAAPSSAVYGTSFDVAASAPDGTVALTASGQCSNNGAQFTMTSGTGTCTVHFNQAGDDNYNAAPEVTESVTAVKVDQSIQFVQPADQTYGNADIDPAASASSGYAVSYAASGPCSIAGGLIHITGAGSCTVTATQAGDSDYAAATPVPRTFNIAQAFASITAKDQAKITDFTLNLGTSAFTVSGLVGSDSISSVTLTSAGSGAGASAGNYAIVPSAPVGGAGTDPDNYSWTYGNGNLGVFNAGIVGLNSVMITPLPGTVDSFDSSLGAYGGSNVGSSALVLSNGDISVGDVHLLGDVLSTQGSVRLTTSKANVSGNVTAGGTVTTNSGHIGGTVTANSPSLAVTAPTVAACSPFSPKKNISGGSFALSSGNLTVVSGTVTLANGTYCFHNVQIGTNAKLKVNGPVTINLTGTLSAGTGQLVNSTQVPADLLINSSFTGSNGVSVEGGANAYMTIVAPSTTVSIIKGAWIGRVVAGTVKMTGVTMIHQDVH